MATVRLPLNRVTTKAVCKTKHACFLIRELDFPQLGQNSNSHTEIASESATRQKSVVYLMIIQSEYFIACLSTSICTF